MIPTRRLRFLVACFFSVMFLVGSLAQGADLQAISAVMDRSRGKAPSAADKGVIDKFIASSLMEVLSAAEMSDAITSREQIVKFRGWDEALSLYSREYLLTAKKRITAAFGEADNLNIAADKLAAQRNLTILTAQLSSLELRQVGLSQLNHADPTVRYWAVKSVAGPEIIKQLTNSLTADEDVVAELAKALSVSVQKEKR